MSAVLWFKSFWFLKLLTIVFCLAFKNPLQVRKHPAYTHMFHIIFVSWWILELFHTNWTSLLFWVLRFGRLTQMSQKETKPRKYPHVKNVSTNLNGISVNKAARTSKYSKLNVYYPLTHNARNLLSYPQSAIWTTAQVTNT